MTPAITRTDEQEARRRRTVSPALGGALGSYALVGVLVGALLAGTVSDVLGRRKLVSYAWSTVAMGITALTPSTATFGLMRCQRARERDVDLIGLEHQHHRGSVVAEHVIRHRPHCSILLARPPDPHRT